MTHETAHWLRRSEQEAIRAIQASEAKVAAIHHQLCLLCVGQALNAMPAWQRPA
ncbi:MULTISPECIES: hypothetical protein [unclassified Sphingomonas]|uniref:hypothetical protein n=1 Tax=unclassified Sphingomonas TaxID=196159 RepID=UPI001F588050|nr:MULTISPECIES: hypothetical protein [unclassified Sphingomonas]